MTLSILLFTAVLPSVAAGIVAAIALQLWKRRQAPPPRLASLLPIGLAVGYVIGQWGLAGSPFASSDVANRLIWIALGAALWGLIEVLWQGIATWASVLVYALASAATSYLLIQPLAKPQNWATSKTALWTALTAAAITAFAASFRWIANREPGRLLLFCTVGLGTLGSGLLIFAGYATGGQLAGAQVGALAAVWVVSLITRPEPGTMRGLALPLALVLGGQWIIGLLYDMPAISFGLISLAPFCWAAAVLLPKLSTGKPLVIVRLVLLGLLAGGALLPAGMKYFADAGGGYGGGSYGSDQGPKSAPAAGDEGKGPTKSAPEDDDYGY